MHYVKTVYPSTNKWIMLTAAGFVSAVSGLGVYSSCEQPHLNSNTIPEISLLENAMVELDKPKTVNEEEVKEATEEENIPQVATQVVQTQPVPEEETEQKPIDKAKENKYPVDEDYWKNAKPWSMAAQYKDYVVLAPAGTAIWEEKAKKLKAMAEKNKWVNTYRTGYLYTNQIDAEQTRLLCFKALSHSERKSFWDYFFTPKSYFDFVWDICGKERIEKPETWWYR